MTRVLLAALAVAGGVPRAPTAELEKGNRSFQAGDYVAAAGTLSGLPSRLPRTKDYALYLWAESAFYAGDPARAESLFSALGALGGSRFATVASWRAADCLWALGKRAPAG